MPENYTNNSAKYSDGNMKKNLYEEEWKDLKTSPYSYLRNSLINYALFPLA